MADRTVQELGEDCKRLAIDFAEACAASAVEVGSARSHHWGAHLSITERELFSAIEALTSRLSAAEAKLADVEKDAALWGLHCRLYEQTSGVDAGAAIRFTRARMEHAAVRAAMQQGADK